MIIITIISILLVFLMIASVFKGEFLAAGLFILAIIGLAAINGPIDHYIKHLDIGKSVSKLVGDGKKS
jgi:hypothetical protein